VFREIFLDGSPIPVGLTAGNLVHGLRVDGGTSGSLEDQGRRVFEAMARSIGAASGTLDNVAHVSLFFAEPRPGVTALNPLWVATFPKDDDRPTYKFMTAPLGPGCLVHLEYFAVLGARRRVLAVPGVAHTNPIPLGVAIGDYLFSSRILPYDPATGAPGSDAPSQARLVFANAAALLRAGGMSWRDVVQGRAFLADSADADLVKAPWAQAAGAAAPLRLETYVGAPALRIMLELFAQAGGAT